MGRISDRCLDVVLEVTYCAPIRNANEPFKYQMEQRDCQAPYRVEVSSVLIRL